MNAVVFIFRLACEFLGYFGISMGYCPVRHRGLLGVLQACGLGCGDGQRTQEHALTPSEARATALAVVGMFNVAMVYHRRRLVLELAKGR